MKLKAVMISLVTSALVVSSVYAQGGPGGQQDKRGLGQSGAQPDSETPGQDQAQQQDQERQQEQARRQDPQQGMGGAQAQNPETVRQVQQKLKDIGHDVGPVDGQFGLKTQQALRDFQQKQGIQATGQIDQQTMAALEIQEKGAPDMGRGGGRQGGTQPPGSRQGQQDSPQDGLQPPGGQQEQPGGVQPPIQDQSQQPQ